MIDAQEYGEVFTRRWVVDLILDLAGFTPDRDLASMVTVEPSCGTGAFIGAMVERLSESLKAHDKGLLEAADAIRAYDLQAQHVNASLDLATKTLESLGWPLDEVAAVVPNWFQTADFLLEEHLPQTADIVVGNPPYIRMDDLDPSAVKAYQQRYLTMRGRVDIYIGFFEVGLMLLKPGGKLAYICADRWMRNQYGKRLRSFITEGYSLDATIVAHDVDAFETSVSAYPAITVIGRAEQGPAAVVSTTKEFGADDAEELIKWFRTPGKRRRRRHSFDAGLVHPWEGGSDSWPAGSPRRLMALSELNSKFHPLESRARVGIGIATGADDLFIVRDSDIEDDRLLPLLIGSDTTTGRAVWSGNFLANPWTKDGQLVDLLRYPRLGHYFESNRQRLCARSIARRNPDAWYRTIDKVNYDLLKRPKLVFPDMKMTSHPVLDTQGHYPHHGLYYIVSDDWDLEVLGGLLLSKVAEFFIDSYTVKMRGGTLRFQAQYLRRIRLPYPEDLPTSSAKKLKQAFANRDVESATQTALMVYGLEEIPT